MDPLTFALPELYREAGINVISIPGWREPHIRKGRDYLWRNDEQVPDGSLQHHTATPQYHPNRTKANEYSGLLGPDGHTLYQSGGGTPTIVVANAFPAPVSAGYGAPQLLDDFVTLDQRFVGDCAWPDSETWAGNKNYWSRECVLDGTGSWVDREVWEIMVVASAIQSDLFGWSAWRHVGHGQHSNRKVDLWSGEYWSHVETIHAFQDDVHELLQGATGIMTTARWASRLRNKDIDQMVSVGILLDREAEYWKQKLAQADWESGEWNDLRDAVKVRGPLYGYAGQI